MTPSQETRARAIEQVASEVGGKKSGNRSAILSPAPQETTPETAPPQLVARDCEHWCDQQDNPQRNPRPSIPILQWLTLALLIILTISSGFLVLVQKGSGSLDASNHAVKRDEEVRNANSAPQMELHAPTLIPLTNATPSPSSKILTEEPPAQSSQAQSPHLDDAFDRAVSRVRELDDAFSRLKTELVDLQRSERKQALRRRRLMTFAAAIAAGELEIRASAKDPESRSMVLRYVAPGQFVMGKTEVQRRESARATHSSHFDFSTPAHVVSVESGYFIGTYEITATHLRGYLETLQPKNGPGSARGSEAHDRLMPACSLDWKTAMAYCAYLGELNDLPVRLPTEVEWEYAARGTNYIQKLESRQEEKVVVGGPWPVDNENLDRSWCGCVGMNSNVQEWCLDAWDEEAYRKRSLAADKDAPAAFAYFGLNSGDVDSEADFRAVRGSNYRDLAANRDPALRRFKPAVAKEDTVGFRIVIPLPKDIFEGVAP